MAGPLSATLVLVALPVPAIQMACRHQHQVACHRLGWLRAALPALAIQMEFHRQRQAAYRRLGWATRVLLWVARTALALLVREPASQAHRHRQCQPRK